MAVTSALLLASCPLFAFQAEATGGTASALAVAVGREHTCILQASGNVHCYGDNGSGQSAAYTGSDASAVSTGEYHTCVLKVSGNVDCYGDGGSGRSNDYVAGDATAVSAGAEHTCVLRTNGNVDCYGDNFFGQSADYLGGDAIAVSAGVGHTCVLKVGGNVDCYGANAWGEADDYTAGDATAVSAGYFHRCVLKTNGNVDCSGLNDDGQSADYLAGDAIAVSAGYQYTCVLRAGGNVHCYGDNSLGAADAYLGGDATAVRAGFLHTCLLRADGNVACQGSSLDGRSQDYGVPSEPIGLTATTGATGVRLAWSAPASDGQFAISGYTVYRGFSSSTLAPLQTLGNQLSYTDPTCPLGTRCYYRVTALNSFGEGPRSNEASAIGEHVPAPSGVSSCAVYNSQNGNPYPDQQGVVVTFVDGTHAAVCAGPAPPSECAVAGVRVNNAAVCVEPCSSPGPGWSVGASGQCVEAPWVAVYPLHPGCPPAATAGIIVYGIGGGALLTVCV